MATMTNSNEVLHVISEALLGDPIKVGGNEVRFFCPIHGERQGKKRIGDLSITTTGPQKGFGHCFSANCEAKVLVAEWNEKAVDNLKRKEKSEYKIYDTKTYQKPIRVYEPKTLQVEQWQEELLESLKKIYPIAQEKLNHPRALAYLHSRGVTEADRVVLRSFGVGYIPPIEEWKIKPNYTMQKWCDRLLFPTYDVSGKIGFNGRTLLLWEEGMDEMKHKKILDEHDKANEGNKRISRYRKTYITGFFNSKALREYEEIFLVEGTFDALALQLAGIKNSVACGGTGLNELAKSIPPSVKKCIIAFDADVKKIENNVRALENVGIQAEVRSVPDDGLGKDWSIRWNNYKHIGLLSLFEATEKNGLCYYCLNENKEISTSYLDKDDIYRCDMHR